jgi:putative ABC transport system ATP-binding protein
MKPKDLAILRRRTVGYVFQDLNLLAGLTARENVAIPLELDGRPIGEARTAADAALESVGLANLADRFPDDLSGGEQQRVAIARALVTEPRVILADEPTGNLDSKTGADVVELLAGLAALRGTTVVVATHDASLAARAPRRIALRDGRLAESELIVG